MESEFRSIGSRWLYVCYSLYLRFAIAIDFLKNDDKVFAKSLKLSTYFAAFLALLLIDCPFSHFVYWQPSFLDLYVRSHVCAGAVPKPGLAPSRRTSVVIHSPVKTWARRILFYLI